MTRHTWFLDEGRNAGGRGEGGGGLSHTSKLLESFLLFCCRCCCCFPEVFFFRVFFSSNAEKFTSAHETLIAGSKYIVVFHFTAPPDDFKVKARINHGALRYNALQIPPPGQAGDTSLAVWPGQTDHNL